MEALKRTASCVFKGHCEPGLCITEFHILRHFCEDLDRFGSVGFLDISAYEHFNYIL